MKRASGLFSLLGILALIGCGTSNTPTTTGDPLGAGPGMGARTERPEEAAPVKASDPLWETRRVPVFLTATGSPQSIEKLYATIHKVELLTSQGNEAVATFTDDAGTTVELCGLGEKLFPLGAPPLSLSKPVARVRVTLGQALMRFVTGSPTGEQVLLADALPRDAAGRPTITVMLEKTLDPATGGLTLGVDLAKLAATGEGVALALKALPDARGEAQERTWIGTIRGVQGEAPTQKLLLGTEKIALGPATMVLGDGKSSPQLAEGQRVRVRATLDPTTKSLRASRITLDARGGLQVRGKLRSVDVSARTLTLGLDEVSGGTPGQNQLTVSLTEGVQLHQQGSLPIEPDALAQVAPGTSFTVEGVYEPVTGSLAATQIFLETAGPSVVSLTAPFVSGDAKSLVLGAPSAWDGFVPSAKGLPLTLGETTRLLGDAGATLKPDEFLAQAKERGVKAIGLLGKDGKITASRLELLPRPEPKPTPEPEKKPVETFKKEIVSP
jgi:hypothetical protein